MTFFDSPLKNEEGLTGKQVNYNNVLEEQIAIAKQKAGLDLTESGVKMYRFEVVRHV